MQGTRPTPALHIERAQLHWYYCLDPHVPLVLPPAAKKAIGTSRSWPHQRTAQAAAEPTVSRPA